MRNFSGLFLVLALLPFPAPAETCYSYEPVKVSLEGILSRETFPGPPEYESIEDGDKPETSFFLNLQSSICTVANEDNDYLYESQSSVTKIQLVPRGDTKALYDALNPHVGEKVKCVGTFYGAHTGHHHTPVLMTVEDCNIVSKP